MSDRKWMGLVLHTDGRNEIVTVDLTSLDEIYALLGCDMIELVRGRTGDGDVRMYVDESGLLKHLPTNEFATRVYNWGRKSAIAPIVGRVLMVPEASFQEAEATFRDE